MPAKYTPEQFVEAFWARVDRSAGPDACWPWTGVHLPKGYGQVKRNGQKVYAHRVAHELAIGPIPVDKPHVLHECDCPPCCNPAHLWTGTNADNVADMVDKGRQAAGDRHSSRTKPESVARGSRLGQAKLTEADIPGIRAALAAKEGVVSIAQRYGVTHGAIRFIANGRSWKHVPVESDVEVAR